MILEAGATGCKPLDRRTRYVDVNAILGSEDPIGTLTKHFKDIYTDTSAERQMDRDKQECLLLHATDPLSEEEVNIRPRPRPFFHALQEAVRLRRARSDREMGNLHRRCLSLQQ